MNQETQPQYLALPMNVLLKIRENLKVQPFERVAELMSEIAQAKPVRVERQEPEVNGNGKSRLPALADAGDEVE